MHILYILVEYWDCRHRSPTPAEGAHSFRMSCEASFLSEVCKINRVFVGIQYSGWIRKVLKTILEGEPIETYGLKDVGRHDKHYTR